MWTPARRSLAMRRCAVVRLPRPVIGRTFERLRLLNIGGKAFLGGLGLDRRPFWQDQSADFDDQLRSGGEVSGARHGRLIS